MGSGAVIARVYEPEETATIAPRGALAEWLGTGLQNLVRRFKSGRRLHTRACVHPNATNNGTLW